VADVGQDRKQNCRGEQGSRSDHPGGTEQPDVHGLRLYPHFSSNRLSLRVPDGTPSRRIQSLDILRGLVMVVMAIDHIRDFFHYGAMHFAPEDLSMTTVPIFFTRWITHFCAPVFVFFAGTSAYLSGRRRQDAAALSRFLLTRGLWLVLIELTLINFGEQGNVRYTFVILQVMWALGWSMVALSVLIHVPWRPLLVISLAVIAGHNLLDGVQPQQWGSAGWLWQVLHVGPAPIPVTDRHTLVLIYPLIPWIFVMSAGYVFGRVFDLEADRRRTFMVRLGLALTLFFVVLRFSNVYGDPGPWSAQPRVALTLLSFLNANKYPPSLLYLLMTLGPAIVLLGLIDGVTVKPSNPFLVFGKVPFFYYLLHWYVLHTLAIVFAWFRFGHAEFLFHLPPSTLPIPSDYPPDYGYGLGVVYLVWILVIAITYPCCRWFVGVKSRHRSAILSYL
jgi:uncharacterized membrane protein